LGDKLVGGDVTGELVIVIVTGDTDFDSTYLGTAALGRFLFPLRLGAFEITAVCSGEIETGASIGLGVEGLVLIVGVGAVFGRLLFPRRLGALTGEVDAGSSKGIDVEGLLVLEVGEGILLLIGTSFGEPLFVVGETDNSPVLDRMSFEGARLFSGAEIGGFAKEESILGEYVCPPLAGCITLGRL
jgi:hypothetical protein